MLTLCHHQTPTATNTTKSPPTAASPTDGTIWRGINPEEWDDNVNVKNDDILDFSAEYPTNFSKRTDVSPWQRSDLEDRDFLYATCQVGHKWLISVQNGALYNVGYAYLYLLNTAQALWTFLHQPIVVAATAAIAAAYYSGAVSAATTAQLIASGCSSSQSDLDAIKSLIQSVMAGPPLEGHPGGGNV
jgi:hypothetical protein